MKRAVNVGCGVWMRAQGIVAVIGVILAGCQPMCAEEKAAPLSATIYVNPSKVLGPVNPLLTGQMVESTDPTNVFIDDPMSPLKTAGGLWNPVSNSLRPEMIAMCREMNLKLLRFPGGCVNHGWDWKKSIGPVDSRSEKFGVDEVMAFCKAVGAEPLVTMADYVGTPQDAADLVEYLNAPDDGKHPWARKRAENGHPAPYGVKYFEMGNETDHGNHDLKPPKKYSAAEYVVYFKERAKAMKAVDPSIKLGGLVGTGTGSKDPWNKIMLTGLKDDLDYVCIHTYAVGLLGGGSVSTPTDTVMRACLASTDDFAEELAEYRELIKECTGRDIPFGITEYNALLVQEKPKPYRFSFAAGLFSADYRRYMLQPSNNVLLSSYWMLANHYGGMLRCSREDLLAGRETEWKKMPAFYLFRLWGQHFGQELIESNVTSTPKINFEGAYNAHPRSTTAPANLEVAPVIRVERGSVKGASWSEEGGVIRLKLDGYAGNQFPTFAELKSVPGVNYRVSYKVRYTGEPSMQPMSLGLMDERGWDATKNAIGVGRLTGSTEWVEFSRTMTTLPGGDGLVLLWRLVNKGAPLTGTVEVKDLKVEAMPARPPYAAVTASASKSSDGRKVYLILFNKDTHGAVQTQVTLGAGKVKSAKIWTVTGSSLDATNLDEELVKETVSGENVSGIKGNVVSLSLSPISMSALEVEMQ